MAGEVKRHRQTDTSNAEARQAVDATVAQFSAWRGDLARLAVRADRPFSQDERAAMLARCMAMSSEVQSARTELILGLADAPQRISRHSRVADVERALNEVDTAINEISRQLGKIDA